LSILREKKRGRGVESTPHALSRVNGELYKVLVQPDTQEKL